MRSPAGWIALAVAALLVPVWTSRAQGPEAPTPYRAGDVSLLLPASWKTQQAPESALPGVVLVSDGGAAGRLTIARLPAGAAAPLQDAARQDPITAPQTVETRVALEEAGLTPISGSVAVATETGRTVEALSFRCKRSDGASVIVLTASWRSGPDLVRARLQYPEGAAAPAPTLLASIRATVRFRGEATLGFGNFELKQAPLPEWLKQVGGSQIASAPATVTTPSSINLAQPPTAAVDALRELGQIVRDYRGSLVFIEGGGGAGSGFVCQMKDGIFLMTNQHVVAGMNVPRFTRLDQSPISAGAGGAAVGHDIMRFALSAEAKPLVATADVETDAKIGDEIVVLGNAEGARVIQPLTGKLIGIGPDRIEITAAFVPGNSGSPIIHVKSGKVIGIVTYLIQRRFQELADSNEPKVRRFGYRLDSVKQWQPLNWPAFQQDKATADRVEATTKELAQLIKDLDADRWPNASGYTNASLARAVRDLNAQVNRKDVSVADRKRYLTSFFSALRNATVTDITQARQGVRYDFFQRSISEEGQVRDQMFKLFDQIAKAR